ncbi:pentapeptide repeat-containing protein [Phytohabitans houttuyneae]|uniref:Pentapeptide repeat-containing protein n=1 Tax=Phytohabitans houttuyneae TaxID=1076126 RepID=A0A6V8K6B0_9ACTN|nr:pentapeptide repeat-containing protein [Phytohabitans houttuyneae]GFJ76345.1 hypothetical protein Phou_005250 [Phytohabitans houttuyneae]
MSRSRRRSAGERQPLQRWTHVATVLSAITAIVAVVYTGLSFHSTQAQTRMDINGGISDRLEAAARNLSAEGPSAREAAIREFGRIARQWPDDQPDAMRLLASFVRRHTRPTVSPPGRPTCPDRAVPVDVATALEVIGSRDPAHDGDGPINLSGACLNHADLAGADFTCVNLDATHLEDAMLESATLVGAWLTGARLAGASLYEARLGHARMDRALLHAPGEEGTLVERADLSDAVLTGADLRGAYLAGANLDRARIAGADFRGADLTGARLGTHLGGADFTGAKGVDKGAALREPGPPRPSPCG